MNRSTPLGVDPYSRFMVKAFDEREHLGVPTGFLSLFAKPSSITKYSTDSNLVEIEILRGEEKLAAMIQRGSGSRYISGQKNLNKRNFTHISRKYPLIEEEGDISADQLNDRIFGEGPYASKKKKERLRELATEIHQEEIRRCVRLFEVLSAQAFLTGKQDAILGTTNANFQYDFLRKAAHIVTPANTWNSGTQNIFADLDGACEKVRANGHLNPDVAIMGEDAISAFIADATVKSLADNRRFEYIQMSKLQVPPHLAFMVTNGFVPMGKLRTPKGFELWLFTYHDSYVNDADAIIKIMPADQVVVFGSKLRTDRYFGPSEVIPSSAAKKQWIRETFGFDAALGIKPPNVKSGGVINSSMFFFDAYQSTNDKSITVRTQSAPIFAPVMTDGIVTLTGLIT